MAKKDLNKILQKAFGHSTFLIFKISRADALKMNLLVCECGHPPNNHFEWDDRPCAFCGGKCKKYRERARVGKLITQGKKDGKEKEAARVRQAARKRTRPRARSA